MGKAPDRADGGKNGNRRKKKSEYGESVSWYC